MTDEKDINALRYYVARLEGDLAVAENDLDDMRAYCKLQAIDIITLGHEVGRLREALEKIVYLEEPQVRGLPRRVSLSEIARAALAEQKSTQEK